MDYSLFAANLKVELEFCVAILQHEGFSVPVSNPFTFSMDMSMEELTTGLQDYLKNNANMKLTKDQTTELFGVLYQLYNRFENEKEEDRE